MKEIVYNPYKIIKKSKNEKCLDPYHSHFILIETAEQQPVKIDLENRGVYKENIQTQLKQEFNVPIIQIVLGESADKLSAVRDCIRNNVPCLFLKVKKKKKKNH